METTEINEPQKSGDPTPIILNEEAQYFLHQAGKWAKFLGILGFIGTGFIVIASFFMGAIFSTMAMYQANPYPAGMGGFMTFFYLLLAVFYFFFSLYLYRFGNKIRTGVEYNDTALVTGGLSNLKSFFKLMGITTIVIIILYVLIIIGVVIGAAALSNR